jgi:hypothetical protein
MDNSDGVAAFVVGRTRTLWRKLELSFFRLKEIVANERMEVKLRQRESLLSYCVAVMIRGLF